MLWVPNCCANMLNETGITEGQHNDVRNISNFDRVPAAFLEGQHSFNKFQMTGFFGKTIVRRCLLEQQQHP